MTHILRKAVHTREGEGVAVNRLFPLPGQLLHHDPFVLWDEFTIRPGAGFPVHPHRGFEAITYLFSGSMQHADNLGNRSTVGPGGAQRFTAGRGIEHSEMPGEDAETRGIQLWINLPRRLKQIDPGYQEVAAETLPGRTIAGGRMRTIVGPGSPLRLHTEVSYLDILLEDGGAYRGTLDKSHQGFVYLVSGDATLGHSRLAAGEAAFLEPGAPWEIVSGSGCHLMFCSGRPHREPIRQHGSFVD